MFPGDSCIDVYISIHINLKIDFEIIDVNKNLYEVVYRNEAGTNENFIYPLPFVFKIKAMIIPYKPKTSAKININTIPTNNLG